MHTTPVGAIGKKHGLTSKNYFFADYSQMCLSFKLYLVVLKLSE